MLSSQVSVDGDLDEVVVGSETLELGPFEVLLGAGEPVSFGAGGSNALEDQVGDEAPVDEGQGFVRDLGPKRFGKSELRIGIATKGQGRQLMRARDHQSHQAQLWVP